MQYCVKSTLYIARDKLYLVKPSLVYKQWTSSAFLGVYDAKSSLADPDVLCMLWKKRMLTLLPELTLNQNLAYMKNTTVIIKNELHY